MIDFKSVQELIIKAAMHDGISTTIRPVDQPGVLEIIFAKGDKRSAAYIGLGGTFKRPEDVALSSCKHALYQLLHAPYEEINIKRLSG